MTRNADGSPFGNDEPRDLPDADDSMSTAAWTDEDSELDRLYRQAMEAVDAIEQSIVIPFEDAQGAPAIAGTVGPFAAAQSPNSETGVEVTPLNAGASLNGFGRATARQVLEAVLFVGGKPLTTKTLVHLLREEFTPDAIEQTLDEISRQYDDERRPYEIRLTEGGWRLGLRTEFERVRHRVYGLGPKEVKLSQEALEVLALVAYHQPVSTEEITELGKPSPGGPLRQLLRRELIAIERGASGRKDVKYRTTKRFLQLFNLDGLEDLPQAEEIAFK